MNKKYLDKDNKTQPIITLNIGEESKALDCMKQNISFQLQTKNGVMIYIANLDGTQGILTKIENEKQYFANFVVKLKFNKNSNTFRFYSSRRIVCCFVE